MSNFEYKEEYRYPTSACLNVTDNCNLACRYCFVEQHPHYMSLQTAKDAIDYLENNYIYKKEHLGIDIPIHITFFGGEPMLMYNEIIVPLTEYVQTYNCITF